jgi:serine/threonine protein kinase
MGDELAGRWQCDVVLKRDIFSTIERGRFRADDGREVDAVLRRIDTVPWWSWPLAQHLFSREVRALAKVPSGIAPPLLYSGRDRLVRGFVNGVALHIAKPKGDAAYFRSARAALRKLHRALITHNDLAKEQNWLRTPDGRACLTDFQLAAVFRRRTKFFRIAAYEDLRHMLKHKRKYLPDALTAKERMILSRKSMITRVWMASGKKLYYAVTRGLFRFSDREGGGNRMIIDAPKITARLREHTSVRDAAVVAYPDRRAGTGLYAFVETDALSDDHVREFLKALPVSAPERLQIVEAMPRDPNGAIRTEILQLIAMNQIDLLEPMLTSDPERALVAKIVAGRQNLRDRATF